ncbi:MAG: competence/damage-inducible protein A [Candidatus Helarchaeota archaeon]|nr:competence/damage-inducible protein A [Candidatus Helarchaeota archaeon]
MKRTNFELIFTGNELINGKILNTNSKWLAKRITKLGGKITRIIVVPDELKIISETIKESLTRKPDFIITSGGLGSTFDDMTYQAVSDALGIPLKLNSEALKYIEEKYDFAQKAGIIKDGSLNKYRKKMAFVPENSTILYNPVGAAPGALIENKDTQIICLPGVPAELKSIFRKKVTKLIQKKIGDVNFVENSVFSTGFIESEITHVVDKVMNEINTELEANSQVSLTTKSPQIWIKTLVKAPYKKIIIEFHVSCLGPPEIATKNVEQAIELLRKYIEKEGGMCYMEDEI